jgi:hypothetical protein
MTFTVKPSWPCPQCQAHVVRTYTMTQRTHLLTSLEERTSQ